jgi:PleD family two-component response regulator
MTPLAKAMAAKGLVVLIADGKLYSRGLLRSMLQQLEIKSIHDVADGVAALDVICAVNPDIMIVDWELPLLSVPEVLRRVRIPGLVPNSELPVIVVSNSGQSAHVHQAIELGAQHFMVRPISPKMLEQRLSSVMQASRRGYNNQVSRVLRDAQLLDGR